MSKGFDAEFQYDVVAAAMKDPLYRTQAARIVSAHHFESAELEWVWQRVSELPPGEKYSQKLLATQIRTAFTDPDKALDHLKLAKKLMTRKVAHARASLDQLRKFVTYRTLHGGIEKAIKSMERGDVDAAEDALFRASRIRSDTTYQSEDWISGIEARMKRREELAQDPDRGYRVPVGVSKLDTILGGGMKPGDMLVMAALTGVGKSHAAIHSAYLAAIHGIPTLLLDTENGMEIEFNRLDAKFMGAASDRLEKYDLTKAELDKLAVKLAKVKKRLSNMLKVVHVPPRHASTRTVEQALDDMALEGRAAKYAVIDCGDHLKPSDRDKEKRLDTANAFWELKSIADEYEIPMMVTAQLNKEAQNRIASGENLSEAYDKARIASIVVTQNESRREAAEGRQRWFLAKSRGGIGKVLIPVLVDKSRSHFEYNPAEDEPEEDDE